MQHHTTTTGDNDRAHHHPTGDDLYFDDHHDTTGDHHFDDDQLTDDQRADNKRAHDVYLDLITPATPQRFHGLINIDHDPVDHDKHTGQADYNDPCNDNDCPRTHYVVHHEPCRISRLVKHLDSKTGHNQHHEHPTPFTVTDDGRVYGYPNIDPIRTDPLVKRWAGLYTGRPPIDG